METKVKSSKRKVVLWVDWAYDYPRPGGDPGPGEGNDTYYSQGSNPKLFKLISSYLLQESSGLESLWVGEFLWNNRHYHDLMNSIGEKVPVHVMTIPTTGYKGRISNNRVYDFDTGKIARRVLSKEEEAKSIYGSPKNYELMIIPSISVYSPEKLIGVSKEEDASNFYAMHAKFIAGFRKNGTAFLILPSCNSDILSEVQTNTLFAVLDLAGEEVSRLKFMVDHIVKVLSVKQDEFGAIEEWEDRADTLSRYSIGSLPLGNIGFTCPTVSGSGDALMGLLCSRAEQARDTMIWSAQHFTQYGTIGDAVSRSIGNCKRTMILSQTYLEVKGDHFQPAYFNADMLSRPFRYTLRKTKNTENILKLIDQIGPVSARHPEAFAYCCNQDWHGRFLVTEDSFVAYNHNMAFSNLFNGKSYFHYDGKWIRTGERTPDTTKSSLFGEIGCFFVLDDPQFSAGVISGLSSGLLSDRKTACVYGSLGKWSENKS